MRRRALATLLAASLTLASPPAATQSPLDIAALRLGAAGRWEGKLEYLDYSANRWFGIPMKVLIEDQGVALTTERPKAILPRTVSLRTAARVRI